jgi:hypothetical protein
MDSDERVGADALGGIGVNLCQPLPSEARIELFTGPVLRDCGMLFCRD